MLIDYLTIRIGPPPKAMADASPTKVPTKLIESALSFSETVCESQEYPAAIIAPLPCSALEITNTYALSDM